MNLFHLNGCFQEVEVNRDDLNSLLSALKVTDTKFKETREQDQTQKKAKSTAGKEMIDNFWKGKQCLKGAAGWWKYEFCYGRVVRLGFWVLIPSSCQSAAILGETIP